MEKLGSRWQHYIGIRAVSPVKRPRGQGIVNFASAWTHDLSFVDPSSWSAEVAGWPPDPTCGRQDVMGVLSPDAGVERVRLASLVDNLNQAVLMETPERRVARTNQAFCQMFGIPAPPEALVGGDCVEAARSLGALWGDLDGFLARVDALIRDWRTVTNERITLTDGRLLERDFLPVTHADGSREIAWVYRDVTDWERLRAEAESAARQNADLLSAISHDVRTPVTGIVGLIELLQRQPMDGRTRQIVDSVRQSASGLTTMLDDFLDAARADAGLLEISAQPIRSDALVESVTDMVGPLARGKRLLLVTGTAPEVPSWVSLDPGRVRQVLLNLVSNAVKFTAEGVVALTVTVDGGELVFVCRDTGPGLGDQSEDDLFKAFSRGPEDRLGAAHGAGLGLAIAAKLATVMGGSVRVAHTGPQGSTFELRLPLVVPAQPGPVPDPGRLHGRHVFVDGPAIAVEAVEMSLRRQGATIATHGPDVIVHLSHAVPAVSEVPVPGQPRTVVMSAVEPFLLPAQVEGVLAAPVSDRALCEAVLGTRGDTPQEVQPVPLPPGMHVLVVEDDGTNRILIARLLEVLGVEVTAVGDGPAALHALRSGAFDLVLMDIHLPGLDGVETTTLIRGAGTRRLSSSPDSAELVPVIAMTGSSGWIDPQQLAEAGFDATLPKPLTLADLRACLEQFTTRGSTESLDLAVLAELAADLGDDEIVRETVGIYLQELPVRLEAMTAALAVGEYRQVAETAHSLKSASAMLGAGRMAALCQQMETSATASDATDSQLESIISEADQVAAAMTAHLA